MKQIYKILRWCTLLIMILPGMMAVYGVFAVIESASDGPGEFGVNLTVELMMLLFLFLLWRASRFFQKKAEDEPVKAIEVQPKAAVPPSIKAQPRTDPDLNENPEMKELLEEIRSYQSALKKKDFRLGSYITESIDELLVLYQDIVSTPMKNTEKGKVLITEIEEALGQIRDALAEVYSGILEGSSEQAQFAITALKNKLAADGLVKSKYDIHGIINQRD